MLINKSIFQLITNLISLFRWASNVVGSHSREISFKSANRASSQRRKYRRARIEPFPIFGARRFARVRADHGDPTKYKRLRGENLTRDNAVSSVWINNKAAPIWSYRGRPLYPNDAVPWARKFLLQKTDNSSDS